jgi:predicted transcriptional regulator
MKSYLELINDAAEQVGVSLLKAFKAADIPTSTYYRTIHGATELRHDTARKVMEAIETIHALQQTREHTAELRATGQRVDLRSVRAKFKSGKLGS